MRKSKVRIVSADDQQMFWTSFSSFVLAKELDSATASDSELCKVCMDAIADCVFLDCGHMVSEKLSSSDVA